MASNFHIKLFKNADLYDIVNALERKKLKGTVFEYNYSATMISIL